MASGQAEPSRGAIHLHHERIAAEAGSPNRWLLVLHGLFGSGRNWAAVARRIVAARPCWGAVLIDLREHGGSTGLPGPHDLPAAAADVRGLVGSLGITAPAILGHSFGGKVALQYASQAYPDLRQVFVVDSNPGPVRGDTDASRMLGLLRELPAEFASRDEAIRAMQSKGVSAAVAQWMAMNLVRSGEALRWRMDLPVVEELYRDFRRRDLWPVVESPGGPEFHFLHATRSDILSAADLSRLAAAPGNVHVHPIESGHWINAENPEALVRIVSDLLSK